MSRQSTLNSLIHFDIPLADLRAEVAAIGWGCEPAVVLRRQHIKAVLQRFVTGEIDAATVEAWANLIEGRDDIQFDPEHEDVVLDAIHDLANPVLQGRLEDIASEILASLSRH